MNKIYQRIFLNIIVTSVFLYAGFKFFPQNIFSSEYAILSVIYLTSVAIMLFNATELKAHKNWLFKGHVRERATEILIPPSLFSKIRLCLSEDKLNVSRSTKELKKIVQAYQRKLKIPQTLPVLTLATSAVLSLGLLTQNLLISINGALSPEQAYERIAYYLAFTVVGALLSLSLLQMYKIIKTQIRENIVKAYDLFEMTAPQISRKWRLDYKNLLATLSLSIVPLLGLEAYTFHMVVKHQEKVITLEQTQDSLEESVSTLTTKLSYADDENQELSGQLSSMQQKIELVRLQLDKAKKDLKTKALSLSQQEDQLQDLKTQQSKLKDQISVMQADKKQAIEELSSFRDDKQKLTEERQALRNEIAQLQKTLTNTKQQLAGKETEVSAAKKQLNSTSTKLNELEKKHSKPSLSKFKWPESVELKSNRLIIPADLVFVNKTERISDTGAVLLTSLVKNLNKTLKLQPNLSLLFNVHTDILPPQEKTFVNNKELTAAQAVSLSDKMAEIGLKKDTIVTAGLGAEFERDARIIPDALKRNRRIEIILLESVKLDIFP